MTFRKSLIAAAVLANGLLAHKAAADTLQQMFDLAQSNDPQLGIAEAAYRIGQQNVVQGRSNLLPQVNANAGYTSNITSGNDIDETSGDGSNWGVTVSQTLFDLTTWYNYRSSILDTRASESDFQGAQQDFILRVTNAYFDILRAIDTLETTLAEEAAVKSQLDQVQQEFEVGLIAITDVQEAQAAYDDIIASKLSAVGNLGVAFENMTVLTGQDHRSIAPLKEDFPITDPSPVAVTDWEELARENNPDLQSAGYSVGNAEYSLKSALVNNHLPVPRVTLNYAYNETNTLNSGMPMSRVSSDSEGGTFRVTATMPLFTGGSSLSSTRVANERLIQEEQRYDLTERQLIQDVRSSHLLVRTNVAQVNASKQALLSAQTALEATRAGYEVGTRNLVDVLQAERNLRRAERTYLNARYDYIINQLRLKQNAGILNPGDVSTLNQWLDSSAEIARSTYLPN